MIELKLKFNGGGVFLLRPKRILIWISVFGLLLLDSGFYFVAQGGIFLLLQVIFCVTLVLVSGGQIHKNLCVIYALFVFFITVSSTLNGDSFRDALVTIIEFFNALLIAESIRNKNGGMVIEICRKMMLLISLESFVLYLICLVKIDALSALPILNNTGEMPAYFVGFSFAYAPRAYYVARNLGLFWEPGAFSTYILLALGYEMFVFPQRSKAALIILSLTLITTLSTTGIICGLGLWIVFAFTHEKRTYGALLSLLLIAIVCFVTFFSDLLPEYIRFSLFTKVSAIFTGTSKEFVTVNTRVDSFAIGLQLFLKNALTGIGRSMEELKQIMGNGTASCTPINWFAQYGVFVGSLICVGMVRFIKSYSRSSFQMIAFLTIAVLSISTEAFNYTPTLLFLIYLGYLCNTSSSRNQ